MTLILERKFTSLPTKKLVVCEGYGDACFIEEIFLHLNVTKCRIGVPSRDGGHGMGKDAIQKYLNSVRGVLQRGAGEIESILVVPDADLHPGRCFLDMCNALENAEFPVPTKPFSIEGDSVKSGIFIVPGDAREGTLDHLLWDAAVAKNPSISDCINNFFACTGNLHRQTSENNAAKMRMSALVAAYCNDNPWASLGMMWKSKNNPVPIDSPVFQPLANFLFEFANS